MAELTGEDAKHLTRVLRVERGQIYQISDNERLYLAEVTAAHKEAVTFRVTERLPTPPAIPEIRLYAALVKFDHFEWMIEKTTELGVAEIIAVETARSETGLEKAAAKRIDRWRRIALEASQQCRRVTMPPVSGPVRLEEVLQTECPTRLFADEEGGEPLLTVPIQEPVAVLIGPEGGWTAREREQAATWTRVGLGPRILRAETAAMAAVSILSSRFSVNLK